MEPMLIAVSAPVSYFRYVDVGFFDQLLWAIGIRPASLRRQYLLAELRETEGWLVYCEEGRHQRLARVRDVVDVSNGADGQPVLALHDGTKRKIPRHVVDPDPATVSARLRRHLLEGVGTAPYRT